AFERALLIFDGSEKSKQALFIAAYFGEMWRTALTVLTVDDGTGAAAFARAYLELHELDAEFISATPTTETIFETLSAHSPDVVLLGSDHGSRWQTLRGQGLSSELLRRSGCPILIC